MKKIFFIFIWIILILNLFNCENPIKYENYEKPLTALININYKPNSNFINYSILNNNEIAIESFN